MSLSVVRDDICRDRRSQSKVSENNAEFCVIYVIPYRFMYLRNFVAKIAKDAKYTFLAQFVCLKTAVVDFF